MKYIKTIDNIYKTSELEKCEDKRFPTGYFTKEGVPLIAIQESDDIHDLIDRYVVESKDINFDYAFYYDNINEMIAGYEFREVPEQYNFYAAIYVRGKGLINIARINNKGEVEL